MFDYLQQFQKLPKELREKVSSPAAISIINELEKKYSLSLAIVVMQVMIKQVLIRDLPSHFVSEYGLDKDKAESLSKELQERLFFTAAAYLGIKNISPALGEDKEINDLIKDSGIVLPSEDLLRRCRQIVRTYRKGIRSRIDARSALERPANLGGLGLDSIAASRLLKAIDELKGQTVVEDKPATAPVENKDKAVLDKIISENEEAKYDFRESLAKGKIKTPESLANKFKEQETLDTDHELSAPPKELSLPLPEEKKAELEKPALVKSEPVVPEEKKEEKPLASFKPQKKNIFSFTKKDDFKKKLESPVQPEIKMEADKKDVQAIKEAPKPSTPEPVKQEPVIKKNKWSQLFKSKNDSAKSGDKTISTHHLEAAVQEALQAKATVARPAASSDSRSRIEDVKARPKVMGPVDELRYLDLVNFRRLGDDPKEATKKIINKIKIIEKDGYEQMVAAVQAWRQSPVNRFYIRLTQEAVNKGMSLKQAVEKRQAEKKEGLSMDEIEAIVDLNSQLMF